MNPCNEISLSDAKFNQLGSDQHFDDRPDLTYPTITKWGIREMTRAQQAALIQRQMTPEELISDLTNRVSELEEIVAQMRKIISNISKT